MLKMPDLIEMYAGPVPYFHWVFLCLSGAAETRREHTTGVSSVWFSFFQFFFIFHIQTHWDGVTGVWSIHMHANTD